MEASGAEKLILKMLCEVYEKLGIRGEIDHKFVESALNSDQLWAFEWEYQFLQDVNKPRENPKVVKEVVDILDMWSFLEGAFERLDAEQKQRVIDEADLYGGEVKFSGFDANNEDHYSVAVFMIGDLRRFNRFESRELNSHSESVPAYKRMLAVFLPMRPGIEMGNMTVEQIVAVMKARRTI